ncbi:hypothetical protein BH18ACT1_BH18ACT1_17400 [soil metagenome]
MGRGVDKAALFGDRSEAALRAAGAARVGLIGGADLPDLSPGHGPLGGLVTALTQAEEPVVAVLACDLPLVTAGAVRAVVDGLGGHDVAVAAADGRRHPLLAAYRVTALGGLEDALGAGELALRRALRRLDVVEVPLADPAWATNVNQPEDVAGLSGRRRP